MDDLKKLSVDRLRELARKHLGKGHSRLRTKAQLLAALKEVVREPLSRLLGAAESVLPHRPRVGPEPTPSVPPPSRAATAPARRRPVLDEAAHETERAESSDGRRPAVPSPAARPPRVSRPGRPKDGPQSSPPAHAAPPPLSEAAEIAVEEAFFEIPATPRRPRRAPVPLEPFEPEPFASPREVGTDAPVLLVRDPTTLFLFWDFRRELERGAALGLREPRLLLRLFHGPELDRSLELPLPTRSTYVTGLGSGQEYTAEVLLLGRDGWTRPVGSRSAPRRLPPGRVSTRLEVRTLRLPWSEPLPRAPAPSAASAPRHEPLDSPRRVPLPTSPGARGPGQGPGQPGGPRSGRN